jgi:RNA polymerase sigma-70 factor, ECF subfamily
MRKDYVGFDDFYMSTRDRLLRQLTAMTADVGLAEDALQEAYMKAWLRWRRVRAMDNPEAWVRTVAWHCAVSRHRRAGVAARMLPMLGRDSRHRSTLEDPDASETLDIEAALRRVPAEQRRVIVLHDLCGFTVPAIAAEVDVPEGTVKSRLSRGRAAVAACLGPDYLPGRATEATNEGGWS